MRIKSNSILVAVTIAWVAVILAGFYRLIVFETTPGAPARTTKRQVSVVQEFRPAVPTLVMVVHPLCPCTRASLHELARILARCPDRLRAVVLFEVPAGKPKGWERANLWATASAMPNVDARLDAGGVEADRLGAQTSGDCFLIDVDGRLLFSGGITLNRGHEGDNPGSDAIVALVDRQKPVLYHTAVFGCPIHTSPIRALL